jgi:integrase
VKLVTFRARQIVEGTKVAFVGDLSASRVQSFLADLREKEKSVQTSNHYLRAVKQFSRWLVKDRRAADDPLAHLAMLNFSTDRRHDRRPFSETELAAILHAAYTGPYVRRMSGPDRAMLYVVAGYTGLRASELANLTPESFDLDSNPPTVTVEAAYSKHRREDVLPLHLSLVHLLRPWLALKLANTPVWPGSWAKDKKAGAMLQHDLKSAGIPYVDQSGLYADFHSLRHTFITNMVKSGVSPKTAQLLARHSTIDLTMNVYTSLTVNDQASALASLPSISTLARPNAEANVLLATGTDGPKKVPTVVPSGAEIGAIRLASEASESAPICTERDQVVDGIRKLENANNPEENGVSCTTLHQSASKCQAEGARFELADILRRLRFSRPVQSAALPPLLEQGVVRNPRRPACSAIRRARE